MRNPYVSPLGTHHHDHKKTISKISVRQSVIARASRVTRKSKVEPKQEEETGSGLEKSVLQAKLTKLAILIGFFGQSTLYISVANYCYSRKAKLWAGNWNYRLGCCRAHNSGRRRAILCHNLCHWETTGSDFGCKTFCQLYHYWHHHLGRCCARRIATSCHPVSHLFLQS